MTLLLTGLGVLLALLQIIETIQKIMNNRL